jgi:hypothetical protein
MAMTATTFERHRDGAGPDDPGLPRLPSVIDGWVRDGLLSPHSAMQVFSPHFGEPVTHAPATTVARSRLLETLGYIGAGIVTVSGLLIVLDDSVGLGTRVLVGVLIMIAMRHTMRPTLTSGRIGSTPTPPRHRSGRRSTRRAGS